MAVPKRPSRGASGRHFLCSKRLAASVVAEAALAQGDLVVEIGGGTGMITGGLVDTGASVLAIERDPKLAMLLHRRFGRHPAVRVVAADALGYPWPDLPFKVVANLPFAGSGAILENLLRDPRLPLLAVHVIVQWEFASKHAAVWPSTLRGTYWRAWYDVSIARRFHRTAFAPPPSVDSALLRVARRSEPRVPPELHRAYRRFLTAGFSSQAPVRHALAGRLSPLQVKRLARALGFDPAARARDLDAEQWAQLFAAAGLGPCSQHVETDGDEP